MQSAEHLISSLPSVYVETISSTFTNPSTIHGFGLFSHVDRQAGDILTKLDGQIISWKDYLALNYPMEWNAVGEDLLLVRPMRTSYGFINHSRKPNLSIDVQQGLLVVMRTLTPGCELLLDYRNEPLPKEYIRMKGRHYL